MAESRKGCLDVKSFVLADVMICDVTRASGMRNIRINESLIVVLLRDRLSL